MAWTDRLLAVVNSFTGRPSPTDTSAAFQVRAAPVNENFQKGALAVAFCEALGTECTDNTSTPILCKLKPPAGRVGPGDRLTIIEDRPTLRTWCAVVTGTGAVPLVEFADAQLQDSSLAGTADYDTIKDDLILLQVGPLDNASWPKQAILLGGAHGLTGDDIPWKIAETDTIADKLTAAVGPAGNDTTIQFNDAGVFAGSDDLTWDDTKKSLAAGDGNVISAGGLHAVAIGKESRPERAAQVVNADGKFTTEGDVQHTLSIVRKVITADATPTLLASEPLTAGKSYALRGRVIGQTTGGVVVSDWKFEGSVANTAGTSRQVGGVAVAPVLIAQDGGAAAWGLAVGAIDITDTLDITVTGAALTNIGWVLALEMVENGY